MSNEQDALYMWDDEDVELIDNRQILVKFDEAKHPRKGHGAGGGEFTSGGAGGGNGASTGKKASSIKTKPGTGSTKNDLMLRVTGVPKATGNQAEKAVMDYLTQVNGFAGGHGALKGLKIISGEGAVLRYGRSFKPQALPKGYKMQESKQCFMNAFKLAQTHPDLTYVEGFATPDFAPIPMQHAWCVDDDGNVFDNTWKTPGSAYVGIPMTDDFVNERVLKTGVYGVLDHNFYREYAKDGVPAEAIKFIGKKTNPKGVDTQAQYQSADGTWTPERQALHARMISDCFEGHAPVKHPTSYIFGGGQASGKSTVKSSGTQIFPDDFVSIDPDQMMTSIYEYNQGLKTKDVAAAAHAHEEVSSVAKEVIKKAAAGGYNLVVDGTGDTSMESLTKKVNMMRAKGQRVEGVYVTVDTDEAVRRALKRGQETGRYIPESILRETHRSVSAIFPQIVEAGLMDSIKLYDNNGRPPVLIAKAEGKELTILDKDKYQKFLDKAKEEPRAND